MSPNSDIMALEFQKGVKMAKITMAKITKITLEQHFPSPKDRPLPDKQTNVVYKINCADCSWSYIGENGRAFETRKKEHKRNVGQFKSGSNIAKHAWTHDH